MAGRLRDDNIRFILSLEAKGVQAELTGISSKTQQLQDDNKKLAADLKETEKWLKESEKAMARLEQTGKTTGIAYRRASESFAQLSSDAQGLRSQIEANSRAIEDNNRRANEMIQTMRLEDMTMNQLRQRAAELEKQLNNTSKSADPAAYNQLERELNDVRSRMGELGKGTQDTEKTFGLFSSTTTKALGLIAVAFGSAKAAASAFQEIITSNIGTAREFNAVMDGLGNVLDYTKTAIANLDFTNFIEGLSEVYRVGKEVSLLLAEMFERENSFKLTSAPQKAEIEQLKTDLRDVNLSYAERLKIGEQIIQKTDELAKLEKDIKQQALDANIQRLESHTKLSDAEREYVITNYNNNRQQIMLAQKILALENKRSSQKNATSITEIQLNAQITKSLNEQINALRNSADFSEMAYNSIKKYMTGSNELVSGFVNSFEALLQVNTNTNREKRRTETMINQLKRSSRTGSGSSSRGANKAIEKEKKQQDKELEDLETKHQQRIFEIKEKYKSGEIQSEADLHRKIFADEQAYYSIRENTLQKFIENTGDAELKSSRQKQLAQVRNKQIDEELKFRKALEKIILDADPVEKEMRAYEERLSALSLFGLEKEKMTAQQLEALELLEQEHKQNLEKIEQDAQARRRAQSEKDFENRFASRREEMQLQLNDLMQQAATLSGSGAFEAEMAVHLQRLQMIHEEVEARTQAGLDIKRLLQQQGKAEAALTKTLREEAGSRYKTYTEYTSSLGNALGSVLTDQKDALKAFGDSLIDIFFDIISKIIETKIMEATAVAVAEQAKAAAIAAATPDSVLSFGATAVARTAAIGAIIMGALQAAKATLKGLLSQKSSSSAASPTGSGERVYSGFADGGYHQGYTGNGSKYQVKGFFPDGQPYHAGEYIIPQEVLRMPAVAPVIRQIESVRRSYSDRNPLPDGFADGGYHADTSFMPVSAGMDSGLIKEFISALQDFQNKKLEINYYEFENAKKVVDTARSGASKR